MNLAGCCAVALGLVAAGLGPQPTAGAREHVIDLTTAPTISSGGGVPDERQLTPQVPPVVSQPLEPQARAIRVLRPQLDRADYRIGQPFFFDVIVENTGSVAIEFPTLLDGGSVDRQMPGAALVVVCLEFKDEILGLEAVGPQFLYGARDVPGSLIIVQPHEFVRIRAQARWLLIGGTGTPKPDRWPRPLEIDALVNVVGNGVRPIIETSRETVPVVLHRSNPSNR
jgi:hypothetical protein